MKGKCSLFSSRHGESASGNISFMPKSGEKAKFAKYIANRPDVDPNGMFDVIAHGNSDFIEISNQGKDVRIKAREAAKIIKKNPDFRKSKSVRLFSCSTGSTINGFAQHLANALGKPVYAPNMTIYANPQGAYWIEEKGKYGKFIKFVPGGYRNGK